MERDPLDALFERALVEHGNEVSGKRSLRTAADYDANYRQSFTQEANWKLTSQVELVHIEGNIHTLVGLFDEFKHVKVRGCRRLIAASERIVGLPSMSEEVHGDHWLPFERLHIKRQPTEHTKDLCCDLVLDMGQALKAEAVLLHACLVGGGLQRLLLQADTTFEGHTPRTILQLPAGLDVLEGLTKMCKEVVWRTLNERTAERVVAA